MSLYEKHKEIVDLMMRETFNDKKMSEILLGGDAIFRTSTRSTKELATLYFTGNDILNEKNIFIYRVENDTDFKIFKPLIFTEIYNNIKLGYAKKFFKHTNYDLEINNAIKTELICKKIFGKYFMYNSSNKIYTKESDSNNIINYYENNIAIKDFKSNRGNIHNLKYAFTDDIFKDKTFTQGLQNILKCISQIEFDINDITEKNIDEIGKQVQLMLY